MWSFTALFDDERRRTGFAKVNRDITGRKNQDEVLVEEHRRLHTAEAIGHLGSWELDLDSRLVTWSDALDRLYGKDPSLVPEQHPMDVSFLHVDDREMMLSALEQCEHSGAPLTNRYRLTRRNEGELRWFEVHGERHLDGSRHHAAHWLGDRSASRCGQRTSWIGPVMTPWRHRHKSRRSWPI